MLQRYFQKAEQRRLRVMLSPAMARRSLNAYATALDIQDRINDYTLFQGILVRRHAQVFRGATGKVTAIWQAFTELIWAGLAVAGAAGILLYLDQAGAISLEAWLGSDLFARLPDVPPRGSTLWIVIAVLYVYVLWALVRLRRKLHQRDVGAHERVAAL
jgi:hypothetical protein